MTQYTLGDGTNATQMMWDAGLGGGGPFVHCSCGKDHSSPTNDDDDYDYNGTDHFYYIELDGQLFVDGCEGCQEKLAKYENFIWKNRNHIREYLKIRINQEKAWADQEHILNIMADIK